uniref:Uncharacterized protein n=1 Tax=viral metagenome TaxID=1070528 RepID=A0A6C0F428_9ZZZZ
MSKKIFMDAFFTQFHEFMGQLIKVFPDDTDFRMYDDGVALIQRVNPAMVLTEFVKHVGPFDEVIRNRDDNFFMNHTFDSLQPDDTMEQVIQKLKGYWSGLSEQNKSSIWGYIILLLDISKRCA